jgi:hypothetical protein
MSNPLQKYFRQPKIFISLPSKGLFYPQGTLAGDYSSVPIFAMTGMDEIIMKTPDALFSGEATIKLIESCCPYIKDAHYVPSLDIDALLIAIRIATFGESMSITTKCRNCEHENDYDISLPSVLDQISQKTFNNVLNIDELIVTLRPLTYTEMTEFNIENFKLQKMLVQLSDESITETEKQNTIDGIYLKLAEIQGKLLLTSIESIKTPEALVTDRQFIAEWLSNTIKDSYNKIKEHLEKIKKDWTIPAMEVKCNNCGHEDKIEIALDQSSFFD